MADDGEENDSGSGSDARRPDGLDAGRFIQRSSDAPTMPGRRVDGAPPLEHFNAPMPPQMAAMLMRRQSSMSGPLPPPSLLAEYERASPGLASRIVDWAEDEAKHRRKLDMDEFSLVDHAVRTQLGLQRLGVLCGLVVALAGLIATVALAYLGHGVAAGVVGTVDLVALVSVFVVGRRTQVKVEEARAKAMAPVESESEAEADPEPPPKAIAGTKAGKKARR